ncbi:hypothetical protein [Geotalea toluenoxydans]|uniref:hypothetical protein n=1 Tax=Geotalea toluenoxydans TaxID=421624 RepID=UPI000AF3D65B|nr:hypothetical protein [Geotalea toluenoxydans]
MPKNREAARANLENLYRIFTVPEAPDSTLGAIDQAIAADVTGFLQTHIVAIERDLEAIEPISPLPSSRKNRPTSPNIPNSSRRTWSPSRSIPLPPALSAT